MKDSPKVIYIKNRPPDTGLSDAAMLEQVFREHQPALRRFLRARLVQEVDQDEIIQDIFVRLAALDNVTEKLSSASGNTLSYLFSIATHLIIDRKRRAAYRRESQHGQYEEESIETDQMAPDQVAAIEQQLNAMMTQLNKLKPKCRQAFILSRFEHKSYPEIAREMQLSIPSVERYITIALAVLRKELVT